jgi:hypothetical protein
VKESSSKFFGGQKSFGDIKGLVGIQSPIRQDEREIRSVR